MLIFKLMMRVSIYVYLSLMIWLVANRSTINLNSVTIFNVDFVGVH